MRIRLLRAQHGFSMLELAVTLAVLAALIAMFGPPLMSALDAERSDGALTELAQIHAAVVGDQRATFGYVGDVGVYPASLADLVIDPGSAGWNGPYLDNARIVNNLLVDPYGQPYEYYLLQNAAGADRLAVISRGADGLSTNGAANPNVATNFSGALPTDAGYFGGTNNADNLVYPTPSATNANALNLDVDGTLGLNLQNFDSNALVNAFVPACPNLYRVTVTSQVRGTNEVTNVGYGPGFAVALPQGPYRLRITAQNLSSAPINENVTALPGQTVTRSRNITGLDSSGTTTFVLTVRNSQAAEVIQVYQFNTLLTNTAGGNTVPAAGAVRNYNVRGCAQVYFKANGSTAIRDQMIMTWGATTRVVGGTAATLTVTNNNTATSRIRLFSNGVYFGEVKRGKTRQFTVGLVANDGVTVFNKNGTQIGGTTTLIAGANTLVVS